MKFLGVGLVEGVSMSLFVILFIIMLKVIANKYKVEGLSDLINTI